MKYVTKIHNLEIGQENKSVKDIQELIEECQASKECKNKDHLEKLIKLQKWVKSECAKIISLNMEATPKTGAYVYFNAALETGYTEMFIKIDTHDMYPQNDCRSVEILKGRYNDGNMIEGDKKIDVYYKDWFFCKPKNTASTSACKDT